MKSEDLMLFQFASDFDYFKYDATLEAQLKFFNDAHHVWDNQTYSDVNIQDEKGNTVLHYLFRNSNWEWVDKFLQRGANPFIKNNEGKDAFSMANKMDQISPFWERYKNVILDDSFKTRFAGYHHDFKQLVFQDTIKKYNYFIPDVSSILQFLDDNQLNQSENIILALGYSSQISLSERIDQYLSLTDLHQPLHQTKFLFYISKNFNLASNEPKLLPLLEQFLSLPLEHNSDLDDVMIGLMARYEYKSQHLKYMNEQLIDLYIMNQWDMNQEIVHGITVENTLPDYPAINAYYMKQKLSFDLDKKDHTSKMKL